MLLTVDVLLIVFQLIGIEGHVVGLSGASKTAWAAKVKEYRHAVQSSKEKLEKMLLLEHQSLEERHKTVSLAQ